MRVLLGRIFLVVGSSISSLSIYHAILLWLVEFLLRNLIAWWEFMVWLMVISKRVYTNGDFPKLLPAPPSLRWAPADPRLHRRPSNTSRQFWFSLLWSHGSFPLSLGACKILFVPSKTGVPISPSGSLVVKSLWPSRSDSLGIPRHFVRSQAGKPGVGFRTLTRVGNLLWYYCSSICHPPGGRGIWLLWFCPSYYLTVAPSLSLDVGCLFLVGSGVLLLVVVRCSTASCDFGALAGGGMCASFYSAILNQPRSIDFWEFNIETPTEHLNLSI